MSKTLQNSKKQDLFRKSKRLKPVGTISRTDNLIDTRSWIIILVLFSSIISVFLLAMYLTPIITNSLTARNSSQNLELILEESSGNLPSGNSKTESSSAYSEEFSTTFEDSQSEEISLLDTEPLKDTSLENELNPELLKIATRIPQVLYLHTGENSNAPNFSWVPQIFEQRVSEKDIAIDLSNFLDSSLTYELTDYLKHLVNLVVHYEANAEPFLGQVLVAEDVLNRLRSGFYGPDVVATLVQGYEAKLDSEGNFHLYYGSKEILEASESVQEAVELALNGSNISYFLLKAVTDFRNEQFGLELDNSYYQYGAMYHYSPESIAKSQIKSRSINRVPVSFQYAGHIFYGFWLPKEEALPIS